MTHKTLKTRPRLYVCWLCGHVEGARPEVKSMRDESCPNCRVASAFVPHPGREGLDLDIVEDRTA